MDAEGRLAITGSADGTGRVWDLASAQCIHILSGHEHSSGHASGENFHVCENDMTIHAKELTMQRFGYVHAELSQHTLSGSNV